MGLTLLVAGLAERLHISAAVGAFLVGLALSGPAQQRIRSLLQPLRDLFAGEFSIVIAELAVTAGIDPGIGALATAYVLLLATIGPLATRLATR